MEQKPVCEANNDSSSPEISGLYEALVCIVV
jgi:hypothetical protein